MAKMFLCQLLAFMMVALELAHVTGNDALNKRDKRDLLVRSKRRWVLSTFELVEEDPGPFPRLVTKMFNDQMESNRKFHIKGKGVDREPVGLFYIEDDGSVFVTKTIDRDTKENELFHIEFDILDKVTGEHVDRTLAFDVKIKDINDNAPIFQQNIMTYNIPENLPEGYLPGPLNPIDKDEENTVNSSFSIRVVSQQPSEPKIFVKQVDGNKMNQLAFTGCFDYDKVKKYVVEIEAKDKGTPPMSSTATVILNIMDSNTHTPEFKDNTYKTEIKEMESNKEILRVAVTDADTPNTPGWRAVYTIVKGNEDRNYEIVTDPTTNEGVLTVIKGKDFERTTFTNVLIAVKNEEPLFVCNSGRAKAFPDTQTATPITANVTVKVIDVNDPPVFAKNVTDVYEKEEEKPGSVLYKPKVTDADSDVDKIRYELVNPADPPGWITLDPQTGEVTKVKPMDRESSHVKNNIYSILIRAIDNGEPPASATGTVLVHLQDINDNVPFVVKKDLVMCSNKVIVPVEDKDESPYACPCTLFLEEDDTLKTLWKLDPATGMNATLVSLKSLPYGNYTVPLVIEDQQSRVGHDTVVVLVCDCGEGDKCRSLLPRTSTLGQAAIGLMLAGMLLLSLLLFLLLCECNNKKFTNLPANLQDEGNQTLIKYNEEGGGSDCKNEPVFNMTPSSPNAVTMDMTDGMKQTCQAVPLVQEINEIYQNTARFKATLYSSTAGGGFSRAGTFQRKGEANGTLRSQIRRDRYQSWSGSRNAPMRSNTSKNSRSFSLMSDQHISDQINRGLHMVSDDLDYQPFTYADEGTGSKCQSLEELSVKDLGDDLEFLNDLGSKFKTLGGICHQDMQERSMKL